MTTNLINRTKRKTGIRLLTAILTVALVLTMVPQLSPSGAKASAAGGTKAKAAQSQVAKGTTGLVKGKDAMKAALKKKQAEKAKPTYAEGEAIVLSRTPKGSKGVSAYGVKAFGKSDLPKGATIEETLHFDGSDSKDVAAKGGTFSAMGAGRVDTALLASGIDIMRVKSKTLSTKELISQLSKNPKVLYAEPNYRVKATALNDQFSPYLWQVKNEGQHGGTVGKDIGLDSGAGTPWGDGIDGKDVVVAVVDTGFDFTHEDLKNAVWTNTHLAKLAGKHGYNFAYGTSDPQDDAGHGTHVAGIIAADHNSVGVAGLAPGVKIMPLKFLDSYGMGWSFDAIASYEYIYRAMELGANVKAVNNSWGGISPEDDAIMKSVIDRVGDKGAVSVCAAGNDGIEIDAEWDAEYHEFFSPATIKSPYIVSVAASGPNGGLADYSNHGKDYIDLAAPGNNILSSVSYPSYNPMLEKELNPANQNSQVFEDFDNGSFDANAIKQADCTDGSSFGAAPASSLAANNGSGTEFFGKLGGKSLEWEIPAGQEGQMYNLYIPYDATGASTKTAIHFNADFKIAEGPAYYSDYYWGAVVLFSDATMKNGALPNEFKNFDKLLDSDYFIGGIGADDPQASWENLSAELRVQDDGKDHALVFTYFVGNDAKHVVRLDNIGISKANDPEQTYGKYAFYSGTSMATPAVTAAVALTAHGNPSYSGKKLAAKVKTMAEPEAALAGKLRTDGILNLGGANGYKAPGKPYIDVASISGANVKLSGFFFGSSAGTVAATAGGVSLGNIAASAWKDEEITLPGANLKNRLVDFSLTTSSSGNTNASAYIVKGKKGFAATEEEDDPYASFASTGLVFSTDGNELYAYSSDGATMWHQQTFTFDDSILPPEFEDYDIITEKVWVESNSMDAEKMFPGANDSLLSEGIIDMDGGLVYLNGKFYGIATLEAGAVAEYALVSYDVAADKWEREADRPGAEVKGAPTQGWENLRHSSLAAYNGKIYLIGGFDGAIDKASTLVRVFDPATKKWTAGTPLPSGRFYSDARQVGDKLVVTFGGNGSLDEVQTPDVLIFDGRSWSSAAGLSGAINAQRYDGKYPYFSPNTGLIKGGLIFSGLAIDRIGDTYTYDVASKKFTASDYQLSQKHDSVLMGGVAVGGTYYSAVELADSSSLSDIIDMLKELLGDLVYISGEASTFQIGVPSGLHSVSGNSGGGTVEGYGSYLPGQKVTLKATPEDGWYFKELRVDGKAVKGDTYTFTINKDTKVDAVFGEFATRVKLNKKSANLKPGKSVQLKATVTKAANNVKGVTWKSSNSKYATVSATGKVTAKKAGLGKTVTITATAKDGSKKSAKATIKIFTKKIKKLTLKAKKSVKAGKSLKIKAKFKPAKGVLKALRWKVTKGAKYAMVTTAGKLITSKKGKGKTITITAYATDGSKKKASIKIKLK